MLTFETKRSQSMVKDLERKDGCPYKFYHKWVHGAIPRVASKAMEYGIYFETQVIGGSAHGEGLSELPLTKTGKKTIDQERIDQQAEYARGMLFDKDHEHYVGFQPKEFQLELYDPDINFRGTIDIYGIGLDGRPVIADLKLTANVNSTFGDYAWGSPENMDFLQQVLYSYLFEKQFKIRPRNLLLVYDFSPEMGKKVLEIELEEYSYDNMFDRLGSFEQAINHYNEKGYTKYPSLKECDGCPFDAIKCDTPFTVEKVSYQKLKV